VAREAGAGDAPRTAAGGEGIRESGPASGRPGRAIGSAAGHSAATTRTASTEAATSCTRTPQAPDATDEVTAERVEAGGEPRIPAIKKTFSFDTGVSGRWCKWSDWSRWAWPGGEDGS
jgi:hypothetical protein